MDELHRKVSMALGIAPGVVTFEQQVDLLIERNAELELKIATLSLEKIGTQAILLDAMEEVEKGMSTSDLKPNSVKRLFNVLLHNFNTRMKNSRG